MDHHELISAIKQLALDLGKTPTKAEFVANVKGGDHKLAKFGGFTALLQAAGLETYEDRRSKNKNPFQRDITKHLEDFRGAPKEPLSVTKEKKTIAVISDIHWPFQSDRVVNRFIEYVRDEKPQIVIINGDAWDMYSHGRFPRSHNVFTPRDERAAALSGNTQFWADIQKANPLARCIQTLGNHDVRPMKQILEAYPEAEDWIAEKLREDFSFKNVETVFDPRQEVIIGDVAVFHGYRSQLGAHRDFIRMNSIVGHTHKGGVVYRSISCASGQKVIWELNSGYAGDPNAKGLTYTPQRITDWTPGFGAVDKYGPRFIPL